MIKSTFNKIIYPIIGSFGITFYCGYKYFFDDKSNNREYLNKILKEKIDQVGEEDSSVAQIYEKLGILEKRQNDLNEAIKNFKLAIRINQEFGDTYSNELAFLYKEMAECFKFLEKDQDHLLSMKASFEWKFKSFDTGDFEKLNEYLELAKLLDKSNLSEEAEQSLTNLSSILASLISEEITNSSPKISKLKDIQIDCLLGLGKINFQKSFEEYKKIDIIKAQNYFEEALHLNKTRTDENLVLTNQILFQLARTNFNLKKLDKALSYCKDSFAISETLQDRDNISFVYCSYITGSDYLHLGNRIQAEKHLVNSIEIFEKMQSDGKISEDQLKDSELQYSQSLTNLGLVYLKQKKIKSSIECTKKGLTVLEKLKGDSDRDYLAVKYNLAVALLENGEKREAWDVISDVYLKSKNKFGDAYPLTSSSLQFINMFTLQG